MGIGGAMIMPATLSVIMDVFPREERAKAIGIWSAIAASASASGRSSAGCCSSGFRGAGCSGSTCPIVVVACVAGHALVPESRDPKPGAFDLVGAALSIAALVTLVYAIIEATPRGWADPVVLGGFVAALASAARSLAWERRVASPMLPLKFFRDPRFTIASLGIGLVFFALIGSIFAFTQFLQFAQGYSALEAGAAMLPLALGLVLGAARLSRRPRARPHAGHLRRAVGVALVLSTTLLWTPDMAPACSGW